MRIAILAVAAAGLSTFHSAFAQTACVTPNCSFGGTPAACVNRAAPRTPVVFMTTVGVDPTFVPSKPKIEPGDCITWQATTAVHSAVGSLCPDDALCGSPSPLACQFDSGNVNSLSPTPFAICAYDPASFPAGTGTAYYCRIHATPTTGTMRGTLQVTTAINLSVNKDLSTSSVTLSWTGGGVPGDASYKVARQSAGDPAFPAATTTTLDPDSGILGTTFTDAGDLANPATHYYLVRNRQTNEIEDALRARP